MKHYTSLTELVADIPSFKGRIVKRANKATGTEFLSLSNATPDDVSMVMDKNITVDYDGAIHNVYGNLKGSVKPSGSATPFNDRDNVTFSADTAEVVA